MIFNLFLTFGVLWIVASAVNDNYSRGSFGSRISSLARWLTGACAIAAVVGVIWS